MNPSAATPTAGTLQSTEPALPAGSVLTQVSSALGGILLLILLAGCFVAWGLPRRHATANCSICAPAVRLDSANAWW